MKTRGAVFTRAVMIKMTNEKHLGQNRRRHERHAYNNRRVLPDIFQLKKSF
jgi:hypothetical protein